MILVLEMILQIFWEIIVINDFGFRNDFIDILEISVIKDFNFGNDFGKPIQIV